MPKPERRASTAHHPLSVVLGAFGVLGGSPPNLLGRHELGTLNAATHGAPHFGPNTINPPSATVTS